MAGGLALSLGNMICQYAWAFVGLSLVNIIVCCISQGLEWEALGPSVGPAMWILQRFPVHGWASCRICYSWCCRGNLCKVSVAVVLCCMICVLIARWHRKWSGRRRHSSAPFGISSFLVSTGGHRGRHISCSPACWPCLSSLLGFS